MSRLFEVQGFKQNGWKTAQIDETYLYLMNEFYSEVDEFRRDFKKKTHAVSCFKKQRILLADIVEIKFFEHSGDIRVRDRMLNGELFLEGLVTRKEFCALLARKNELILTSTVRSSWRKIRPIVLTSIVILFWWSMVYRVAIVLERGGALPNPGITTIEVFTPWQSQ